MRLRWRILIGIMLLPLGTVLYLHWFTTPDLFTASYKGQTLKGWLHTLCFSAPTAKDHQDAIVAVRVLTTNNLPELVSWLGFDPTEKDTAGRYAARQVKSYWRASNVGYKIETWFPDRANDNAEVARTVLEVLGPEAIAVLPQLEEFSRSPKYHVSVAAFLVLRHWGTNALPVLLRGMSDATNLRRAAAIETFAFLASHDRTNFGVAMPVLLGCMDSKDPKVVCAATKALALLELEPDRSVSVLVASLSRPEPEVRAGAVAALGHFSGFANQATPEVRRLLTDPVKGVRVEATNALRQIMPAASAPTPAQGR